MATNDYPRDYGYSEYESQSRAPGGSEAEELPEYVRGSAGVLAYIIILVVAILAAVAVFGSGSAKKDSTSDDVPTPAPVSVADVSASDTSASDDPTAQAPAEPVKLSFPPVTAVSNADVTAKLDKIAKRYGCNAVSIAVIKNGEVAETYVRGSADAEGKTPLTPETKIRVASLSKVIVGMTALSMVEDGYLTIDQDISEIAGFKIRNPHFSDKPITMRHLLSHTSTISTDKLDVNSIFTTDTAWLPAQLQKDYPFTKKEPGRGSAYEYSNSGYCIAGYLLELASKRTLNDYVRENFLDPLGIDAAFCAGQLKDQSNIAALVSNTSGSNGLSVKGQLERPYYPNPGENSYPYAGDFTASAKDLARLVCILINDGTYCGHEFLKSDSVWLMKQKHVDIGNRNIPRIQCLTLKQYEEQADGRDLFYHTGGANGMMGYIGFDAETKDGVVVLTIGGSSSKKEKDANEICLALAEVCFSKLCT